MESQTKQNVTSQNKNQWSMQKFLKDINQGPSHQQNHAFMKIVMGKFLIQAYRVFKYFPEVNSAILFKRQQSKTHYIFFIAINSLKDMFSDSQNLTDENQNPIKKMKTIIEKIKHKPQENYSVNVALIQEMKKLTFKSELDFIHFATYCKNSQNFEKMSKLINSQAFNNFPQNKDEKLEQYPQVQCFVPYFDKQNEDILFQSRQQIEDLKEMLTTYIDTFANKEKGGLIYKLIERSSVSFSINMLLNTINYIIFQEMNNTVYSQIEPCYWTCYESSRRSLNSDRKHIVLSGAGQICVLQIIFMKQIESQDKKEYEMMLAEFKKFYKSAKIKIFRITNQKWDGSAPRINLQEEQNEILPQNQCLIYKFHSTVARQYP